MNLDTIKSIHFVGIGGIGMSGIAEILSSQGATVSGCDLRGSSATDLLTGRGISVRLGHDPAHLEGVDLVVVTSAVRRGNPEIDAARARGIRIIKRAELLGELVNAKRGIGVSGTHGKTTTSAMVATVLAHAGLDPTVVVGGILRNLATNAKSGLGEFLVVEADEYDRSFHHLHPEIAVVTNIEADHLEYYGTLDAIRESFASYIAGVKPGGTVIGCYDDENVATLLDGLSSSSGLHVVRYGLGKSANGIPSSADPLIRPSATFSRGEKDFARYDIRAVGLNFHDRGCSFEVPGVGFFKLFVPGEHNVRNALAAIAVARSLGIPADVIAAGLSSYLGVDRRFQILGDYRGAIIVDDYAHHPTEIRATLEAARSGYPDRRLVALFQPHLYSRTRDFAREFGEALRTADMAIVMPIYAAREEPIAGVSARLISDGVDGIEFLDRGNSEVFNEMRRRLGPNDLFITMGAGDVHQIAEELVRGAMPEGGA